MRLDGFRKGFYRPDPPARQALFAVRRARCGQPDRLTLGGGGNESRKESYDIIARMELRVQIKMATIPRPFLVAGVLVLAGLVTSLPAGAYDYTLALSGPQTAFAGFAAYLQVDAQLVEGERQKVSYATPGLAEGITVAFPSLEETCCGPREAWGPSPTLLRLQISPEIDPGEYEIVVQATSGGLTRSASRRLLIVDLAVLLSTRAESHRTSRRSRSARDTQPSIPTWESNMISFGNQHCDQAKILKDHLWEGGVWYYDGIRTFYQLADYLKDDRWIECARHVKSTYLPYVLSGQGRVPGWRVFPKGLFEDYQRTGDPQSKEAVILLSRNSAFAARGGAVSPRSARETAYILEAYMYASILTGERHPRLDRAVSLALGHLLQWFPSPAPVGDQEVVPTTPAMQPFMVGLLAEALIKYYEQSPDPRIPFVLTLALDQLWQRAWVQKDQSFFYSSAEPLGLGTPDLNLLIAPAYAWLYRMTASGVARERADRIFNSGARSAYLAGGKQFSQNYRWSTDFVHWRNATE